MSDYRPLKNYVARRGGLRLAMHARLRDSLVDAAVEEFPATASPLYVQDVLQARLRIRVRKKYGSVLAMLLLSAFVNVVVRLVIEWWLDRNSHRVLMEGWHRNAVARSHVPASQSEEAREAS